MHNFETEERLLPVLRHTGFTSSQCSHFTVFTQKWSHGMLKNPFARTCLFPFSLVFLEPTFGSANHAS